MICPCNPGKLYKFCCKIAHNDILKVQTAEQLMRSRYSAFVLAKMNYLQKSHHSTTRPSKKENKKIARWTKNVEWVKLEILTTKKGNVNDSTGEVAFKAYFLENGQLNTIEETSRFDKEDGYWVYLDGEAI